MGELRKSMAEYLPLLVKRFWTLIPAGLVVLLDLAPKLAGVKLDWPPVVWVALFAAGLIAAQIMVFDKMRRDRDATVSAPMQLAIKTVPPLSKNPDVTFGVLHVRNGRDDIKERGPILNKEYPFTELKMPQAVGGGAESTMTVTFSYDKGLGVQFKCFVDYKGITFAEIEPLLRRMPGIHEIGPGDSHLRLHRAWFLLSGFSVVNTDEGIHNNFSYSY